MQASAIVNSSKRRQMTSGSRGQKVRLDDVRKLDEFFAELPEQENQEIAKTEAIRILLPRISTLLKRGYTISDIAKRLSDGGVPMTAMLLRTYLLREGGTGGRKRSKSKKRTAATENTVAEPIAPESGTKQEPSTTSATSPSAGELQPVPATDRPVAKAKKSGSKPAVPEAETATPKPASIPEPSTSGESEKKPMPGKFIPKPDTDDI